MSYKLYNAPSQLAAGTKIEVLLRFTDLPVELVKLPRDQWQSPEYLQKHPLGKIPTLETPEGCIFESNSIMRYIARKDGKFYGSSPAETASIDQWLEFANTQLQPTLAQVGYPLFGYVQVTKEEFEEGKKDLIETLKVVDKYLKDHQYLGGKDISIADITLGTNLRSVFRLGLGELHRKEIPHVTKWFETVNSTKEFTGYFGKVWLCQKEMEPEFIVKENKQKNKQDKQKQEKPKQDKSKEEKVKEQKPKQEKQKQEKQKEEKPKEDKPKEEGKKKKKKNESGQESEEDPVAAEKKKANPLDLLPKSPFNFDDFKRDFSNSPDKSLALKTLWEKFDEVGYSLWFVSYIRLQGEGKVDYLTNNLKNGYMRNLEHFRKYSFGGLGVYGSEGDYEILGAWIWRGTEVTNEWKDHPSYDGFAFKRLNPKNPQDQERCAAYWLNTKEGDIVEGRPVFDIKIFK